MLTDECTLAVPYCRLAADGDYHPIWPDALDRLSGPGTYREYFANGTE